jgi:hypothetical protein
MKKFLVFSAMLGAMAFAAPSIEAKTATAATAADPQVRVRVEQTRRGRRINNRWNNRRTRTVVTTRITRVGRYRYRETIRTTYFANGRTRTQVIRRVRLVGGRRW